jgi:CubicO group peptidase (beta-lactamase class C family)
LLTASTLTFTQTRSESKSPQQTRMMALEYMINASDDESIEAFIKQNIDPQYIKKISHQKLLALLRDIRRKCAQAGGITAEPADSNGVTMNFITGAGSYTIQFWIQPKPPHQIIELKFAHGEPPSQPPAKKLTWKELSTQLEKEAVAGFMGTVLVVRDGHIVLHKGYGFSNKERGIPNSTETIFAIGSTPIDFTKAAVLKLEDMGHLKTSDPITKYFYNVPEDKRTMTLDQLMQGTSGLPNFHHIPGQDEDYDLTWIDRDEAVRRILSRELLFQPGQGKAHSHSAWTLLATVVEIVSKQSYSEFLQKYFFNPLGMKHTGLYTYARSLPEEEVAVGYGAHRVGKINSPAYWGKTSWLVMGSGGMASNPGDLYKWVQGIRSGQVLSEAAQKKYWVDGVLAGGNDRGFFCIYTQGPGTMMFLCSNSHQSANDTARALGSSLARLVMSE